MVVMCCLLAIIGWNGCNSLVECCALGVQLLGQLGNLAQQTGLHAAGNACCLLGIDGACQLVLKCDARRSDLLAYHITHGHSLDVQDLVVLLKLGLHTGMDLLGGVNVVLCEQVEVLLVNVMRECVRCALEVEQTALLRLCYPGIIVAVAVEDDALVRLDFALYECHQRLLEVLGALQLVSELAELLSDCGVQHNVCARDVDRRAQRTELELVAGEGERRGTVAVGGVLRDSRQNCSAQIHLGLVNVGVVLAGLDGIQNSLQLIADEHGDDRRRRLVRAQAVIVAGRSDGNAEQILIFVNRLDNGGQKQDELAVFARVLARLEQVLACIGGNRPVVVLAGAVYAFKRLLMQQAGEAMLLRDGTHDLHGQLVVVGRDVGGGEHRRHLVLARCNLVVLGLGENAQLPQLLVELLHESSNARTECAEVVIIHFLTLRRHCTEQGAAGKDQVLALCVVLAVDQEIFLLRAYSGGYTLNILAEQLEDAARLCADGVHRAQQRRFLIEDLTGVGAECGRNVKGTILYKCVAGRVPCGVAACLEGCAQTAGREGRCVRFALDQLLAGELHHHMTVVGRRDERVVLLGGDAGHRLEPVRVMGCTLADRPVLHCRCNNSSNIGVDRGALAHGLLQLLVNVLGKTFFHHSVVKHHAAEQLGNIRNAHEWFAPYIC